MEEAYKAFSTGFYNRLKNTINASIKCTVNETEDKLYIEISRLGLQYKTSIEDISEIMHKGDSEIEKQFDKVVKKFRSFVNHKFFY